MRTSVGTDHAQREMLELVTKAVCFAPREVGLNQFKVDSDIWRGCSTGLEQTNEQHFGSELEI